MILKLDRSTPLCLNFPNSFLELLKHSHACRVKTDMVLKSAEVNQPAFVEECRHIVAYSISALGAACRTTSAIFSRRDPEVSANGVKVLTDGFVLRT